MRSRSEKSRASEERRYRLKGIAIVLDISKRRSSVHFFVRSCFCSNLRLLPVSSSE